MKGISPADDSTVKRPYTSTDPMEMAQKWQEKWLTGSTGELFS